MKKNDPFKNVMLNEKHPKFEAEFPGACGEDVRVILNYRGLPGVWARGWVLLRDPATGHLLQKDPTAKGYKFETAIRKEIKIPSIQAGEKPEDVVRSCVQEGVAELEAAYGDRLLGAVKVCRPLGELSLGQALPLYLEDFIQDYPSASAATRETVSNQLRKLAGALEGKQLRQLTGRDLGRFAGAHRGGNAAEYIRALQKFLRYTADRLRVEMPGEETIERWLRNHGDERKDNADAPQNRVKSLPAALEQRLDNMLWARMGEPMAMAVVLVKEGGLSPEKVAALRMSDLQPDSEDEEKVFVRLIRAELATGTHDYTFPLSPYGAQYVHDYLDFRAENDPAGRLEGDRYVVSRNDEGRSPVTAQEIREYIRVQCSLAVFGDRGIARLRTGESMSLTANTLLWTRKTRLEGNHRFSGDPGALDFMLHRSMGGQVQSDRYRGFTGETGREDLYQKMRGDRHGCREAKKPVSRHSSRAQTAEGAVYKIPGRGNATEEETIVLDITGGRPGDWAVLSAQGGVLVDEEMDAEV